MKRVKYEYMVSYTIPNGSGRVFITLDNAIKNYKDIENLDNMVKKEFKNERLFVSNFILLRKYRR